CARGYYW
nr:immunoglobulin heavy chain junction region [Mus musculus]MBK4186454.1 immunoglobulin heavy chain junction region [Mus musculus]MBK4189913.1 immunoglobulin heavy chain junction region [Mus musculus]